MKNFKLYYSFSFDKSMQKCLIEWGTVGFSEKKIKKIMTAISDNLKMLVAFPEMFKEVSDIYGFSKPARRILIGKQYAIFIALILRKKRF